jgi:hypothetical protein
MRIEEKVTAFAINEAGWIVWLMLGLSMGVTVGLARAVSLLLGSRALRGASARLAGLLGVRQRSLRLTRAASPSQVRARPCWLCRA